MESVIGAASAIRTGRRIQCDYRSHHEASSHREIEPYAVLPADGRW